MSDNPALTAPQDAKRINVHEDYEVRYWSHALGCTPDALRQAVRAVGVMADDVRRHLARSR